MALETRAIERGRAQIGGQVVRVFRTDGRLAEGSSVSFELWVCQLGDEPTGPAYIYIDALAKACFIEAYLRGTPPACEVAAYEFTPVDAPTHQPVLNLAELEELLNDPYTSPEALASAGPNRVKWWQFWRTNRGA
jgi:hypothetical protein